MLFYSCGHAKIIVIHTNDDTENSGFEQLCRNLDCSECGCQNSVLTAKILVVKSTSMIATAIVNIYSTLVDCCALHAVTITQAKVASSADGRYVE